jgi:hypothetical protein
MVTDKRVLLGDPQMTLDEAVAIFERELPGWWWKIISCSISVEADTAPESDDFSIDAARKVDERFDSGFTVELRHTAERKFTAAEALMAVLADAKAAREDLRAWYWNKAPAAPRQQSPGADLRKAPKQS